MISLEKLMILTPLQKFPNNVSDLGNIIVATSFEWFPKVQKIAQSGHTDPQPFSCPFRIGRSFGEEPKNQVLILAFKWVHQSGQNDVVNSVTRWAPYFSIFGHFQQCIFAPNHIFVPK